MNDRAGTLVVSLDFELAWGAPGGRVPAAYRANFEGVRGAVAGMLALFEEYGIHATWATVGLLFFADRESLLAALPHRRPQYTRPGLSPYDLIPAGLGDDEECDPLHYAPSVIRAIAKVPFQEIGTHTFSHYYCLEPGQDAETFEADLAAARRAARQLGVDVESLVFPINQTNSQYLAVCGRQGIATYRGSGAAWLNEGREQGGESAWRRFLRVVDSYVGITGPNTHELPAEGAAPRNIPSSRFLRPYRRPLRALEPLRLRRIRTGMSHAAVNGRVYHLWWHPHNFGVHTAENLAFLRRILDHFRRLQAGHGMQSRNMGELRSPGARGGAHCSAAEGAS